MGPMGGLKLERTSGGLLPIVLLKEGQFSDQTRLFRPLSAVLKILVRETAPPLWETCSTASLFSWWKKSFSLYPNQHHLCVDLYPLLLISLMKSLDPGSICSVTSTWVQEGWSSWSHFCGYQSSCINTDSVSVTDREREWLEKRIWEAAWVQPGSFPVGCGNPLSGEIALHREDCFSMCGSWSVRPQSGNGKEKTRKLETSSCNAQWRLCL